MKNFRAAQEEAKAALMELRAAQEDGRSVTQVDVQKGIRIGRIQMLQQLLSRSEVLVTFSETDLIRIEEYFKRQFLGAKPADGTHLDQS